MTAAEFEPIIKNKDYDLSVVEGLSAELTTEVYDERWHLSLSPAHMRPDGSFHSQLSAVDQYALTHVEEDVVLPEALGVSDGHIRIVSEQEPEADQGTHKNRVIKSAVVLGALGAAGVSAAVAFALNSRHKK